MDVKIAFLNEVIEEEVYIEQPQGFEVGDKETHVCRLRRALYGIKQAPWAWYSRIDSYLREMGFQRSEADLSLYFLAGEVPLILVLYVDDLFLTGDEQLIVECKGNLAVEFEMNYLGLMHYFLGLEVWKTDGHFFLGQGKYAIEILCRFRMMDCRPMSTPLVTNWRKIDATDPKTLDPTIYRQLIGSLIYLVNTRPDISFAVNSPSQFMVDPRRVHRIDAKHVLRYLRGTMEYGLLYECSGGVRLVGFTDVDWEACAKDRKSTSGCCFSIGLDIISWFSEKQRSMVLSSAEAKYMVASLAACEALRSRKLLLGLFGQELEATVIHCDNQSCIKLFEILVFHDRRKHIDTRYHFIRDCVQRGAVRLDYIQNDDQMADIFTKALSREKFEKFRDKMGLVKNPFLVKREC
jgi:hypothetical protein